jgi:hypothetical protein
VTRAHLFVLAALAGACDATGIGTAPVPVDGGQIAHADAAPEPPDTGVVDAEPDAGGRDAFAPDADPPPPAREPVYIHTATTLYAYDSEANTATPIGDFRSADGPVTDMADIAIDLNGRMFGGGVDREVYLINPLTAACERRFTSTDRVHGMTFLSDGRLVMAGDFVRIVDPLTGRIALELVDDMGYQTSGDIVGLPDGFLYWTVRGTAQTGDLLIRVDPQTGTQRRLGAVGTERLFGLGYADGVLFGFSADGVVVDLAPRDGQVIRSRVLMERWWGATTNPVVW